MCDVCTSNLVPLPCPPSGETEAGLALAARAPQHILQWTHSLSVLYMTFPALTLSVLSGITGTSCLLTCRRACLLLLRIFESPASPFPPVLCPRWVCPCLPLQTLRPHTWSMPGWLLLYSMRVSRCSGTSPWACRRYSARRSFLGPK